MITRATIILFIFTFLLIVGIDLLLRSLNYQAVIRELFDFRNNPGVLYCYLMLIIALIYSVIADLRIKKRHLFKKRVKQ